jgi:hypothetical protein
VSVIRVFNRFDNSNTKKEGLSYTYEGHDRYASIFAYLGCEGYGVIVQLREGKTHCQNGIAEFLKETIGFTRASQTVSLASTFRIRK